MTEDANILSLVADMDFTEIEQAVKELPLERVVDLHHSLLCLIDVLFTHALMLPVEPADEPT